LIATQNNISIHYYIISEIEKNTMFFSGLNLTIPRQPTKPPA